MVAYTTAKAALEGFTRALARELGPRRITVNVVAPGFVGGTPLHATYTPEPAQRAAVVASPLSRAGAPDDIAEAVLFLASDGAVVRHGHGPGRQRRRVLQLTRRPTPSAPRTPVCRRRQGRSPSASR